VARTTPSASTEESAASSPPAVRPRAAPAPQPLAGVTCPLLTAAIRRAEQRWVSDRADDDDPDGIPRVLAAIGLAVDRRVPSYLLSLEPRPPRLVTQRLLAFVQSELLRSWSDVSATSPLRLLRHLKALEDVRDALEHDAAEQFGAQLGGANGLDFLVQIVHDLRSPLTSILFLAETLMQQRSGPVTERQQRQLGLIYSAAFGLSSLTSDTIELARGGDQLAEDRPAPLSVSELLESVCDIVRPIAVEKGLTVAVTLPITDLRLGHALALRRVLLNLTTNALKFTERGSVDIAATEKAPTRITFSVHDTGPGINPEALSSLFHPFRRSAKAGRYLFSGTGLGLALTRRLVRAMGSELCLETHPGWGTQFWFDLELPPAESA
jgi:signal transduction histidine kinase